ncbi:AAA family ATPase [uncultured Chryseobacterium sp.]|uniref:AAA family ATPase n=1 Tax=uncultured Chryseobacterium sp. TaxID=259322 RepID=UPI003747C568
MKLKKLKINSLYHLKDLEFDFTYPEGHEKAGQPLEKICFIGQSATGKTKILNSIFTNLSYLLSAELINNEAIFPRNLRNGITKNINGEMLVDVDGEDLMLTDKYVWYKHKTYYESNDGGSVTNLISDYNNTNKAIYFDTNYISSENIKYFNTKPLEIVLENNDDENISTRNTDSRYYHFKENLNDKYILNLLKSFLDFRQKYDQKVRELLLNGYIADLDKFNKEFREWQMKNPNPIDDFSNKFDILLNKLHLEVDKINVDYAIPFKNKVTEEIVPIDGLSTGTKGLLLYMLPLYQINTSKSIVILDEPERSLYPDIQMELMDFFRKISPNSQIITATHSPFIAASFEPEERFILYFNEEGKVQVRNGSSPIGDDPNDILFNDFGVNYINKYGQKAYDEYKELKQKIYFEKDDVKKKEYSERLEELGEKYNF